MTDDIHILFQQMGEVLSAVRGLYSTIDLRQAQAEQLYELLRSDLALLRHDQHDLEDKFDRASWLTQHDIETLRLQNANGDRSVQELVSAVNALKRPIAEMAAFRSRLAGLLFATGVLGSAALWLSEPIYKWLVEAAFQHR